MLDIKKLPKVPEDALEVLLVVLLANISSSSKAFDDIRKANPDYYNKVYVEWVACKNTAQRLRDSELRSFAVENLNSAMSLSPTLMHRRASSVLDALHASKLDQHFISEADEAEFEKADVPENERAEIRAVLEEARKLTEKASYLDNRQKRRVLHKISKAENELFSSKVGFSPFMAAAYEVSDFVRKFGNDAKPLAEAIQIAATKTERHLEGYTALEAPEKPKQIEGPNANSESD